MLETHSRSAAARKADALGRRLRKHYAGHEAAPMVSVEVSREDVDYVELYVFSDVVPALKVRAMFWLHAGGHARFDSARGIIDSHIAVEAVRQARDAEWLEACAAMSH